MPQAPGRVTGPLPGRIPPPFRSILTRACNASDVLPFTFDGSFRPDPGTGRSNGTGSPTQFSHSPSDSRRSIRERAKPVLTLTAPDAESMQVGQGGTGSCAPGAYTAVMEGRGDGFSGAYPYAPENALPGTEIPNVYRSGIGAGQARSSKDRGSTKSRIARAMRSVQHPWDRV